MKGLAHLTDINNEIEKKQQQQAPSGGNKNHGTGPDIFNNWQIIFPPKQTGEYQHNS
jgi:hypothetical protein